MKMYFHKPIKTLLLPFLFINKTLRLNNLKSRTVMNGKISVFAICVETIIYLLLYDLHDRAFNSKHSIAGVAGVLDPSLSLE